MPSGQQIYWRAAELLPQVKARENEAKPSQDIWTVASAGGEQKGDKSGTGDQHCSPCHSLIPRGKEMEHFIYTWTERC